MNVPQQKREGLRLILVYHYHLQLDPRSNVIGQLTASRRPLIGQLTASRRPLIGQLTARRPLIGRGVHGGGANLDRQMSSGIEQTNKET